jgi:hypothetical protein
MSPFLENSGAGAAVVEPLVRLLVEIREVR